MRRCLLVIFHFALIGPAAGYLTFAVYLFLYGSFDAVVGMRPGAIFEQIVILLTFLLVPIGLIVAYWMGFFPALAAAAVVCAIQISGRRMSWSWVAIVALVASLVGYLRMPELHVSMIVGALVIPSCVATAVCCHLLRRWGMISWSDGCHQTG